MSKKNRNNNQPQAQNVVAIEPNLKDIERAAIAEAEAKQRAAQAEKEEYLAAMRAKYPMRGLNGSDFFVVLGLLGKLNIKDELVGMFADQLKSGAELQKSRLLNDHKEKDLNQGQKIAATIRAIDENVDVQMRGIDLAGQIFEKVVENIALVQNELNEFLASLLGTTASEVAALPLGDYFFVLKELFSSEDIKTVFKSASSLLG